MIAIEFCKEKDREVKARLKEIKTSLEYPANSGQDKPIQEIVMAIEEIDLNPMKSAQPPLKRGQVGGKSIQ